MRPKIVLLMLLAAVAALLVIGLVGGVMGGKQASASPPEPAQSKPATNDVAQVTPHEASVVASTPEEDRATAKQNDLDAISNALIQGDGDPNSLLALESRLDNQDPEVRKAAVEAAIHLGNTNIIPRLLVVMQQLQDPREKVAFLDAVEYLQLPSALDISKEGLGADKSRKLPPRAKPNRNAQPPGGAPDGAVPPQGTAASGN
jgi:hypothetical protein